MQDLNYDLKARLAVVATCLLSSSFSLTLDEANAFRDEASIVEEFASHISFKFNDLEIVLTDKALDLHTREVFNAIKKLCESKGVLIKEVTYEEVNLDNNLSFIRKVVAPGHFKISFFDLETSVTREVKVSRITALRDPEILVSELGVLIAIALQERELNDREILEVLSLDNHTKTYKEQLSKFVEDSLTTIKNARKSSKEEKELLINLLDRTLDILLDNPGIKSSPRFVSIFTEIKKAAIDGNYDLETLEAFCEEKFRIEYPYISFNVRHEVHGVIGELPIHPRHNRESYFPFLGLSRYLELNPELKVALAGVQFSSDGRAYYFIEIGENRFVKVDSSLVAPLVNTDAARDAKEVVVLDSEYRDLDLEDRAIQMGIPGAMVIAICVKLDSEFSSSGVSLSSQVPWGSD